MAANVVPIQAHETLSLRALVMQAQSILAGPARLHKVILDKECLDGAHLWWLQQHGLPLVVASTDHRTVTVDAQAQAAAGEGMPLGRRAHPVYHGQGKTAPREQLETEVVVIVAWPPMTSTGRPSMDATTSAGTPNPTSSMPWWSARVTGEIRAQGAHASF